MKSGAGIQNKAWRMAKSLGVQDNAGIAQEKMEVWGEDSDCPVNQRLAKLIFPGVRFSLYSADVHELFRRSIAMFMFCLQS